MTKEEKFVVNPLELIAEELLKNLKHK